MMAVVRYKRPKPKGNYRRREEESVQLRVCRYLRRNYRHILFRSDFASGLYLSPYQARKHAAMQSSRGWPDLFIYHPSADGKWPALALELKKEGTTIYIKTGPRKGELSSNPHIQEQAHTLEQLRDAGFCAVFALGYDDACAKIDHYMGRPEQTELF